ncbi:MAG: XRE family transcriptional regulator [Bacteroidota bacterium]|nr:XRE family transcriptional regulator [Bacteroidota bacterium]
MKILRKKIKLVVEKTDTGFSAFCKEYPVYTTGQSFTELVNHAVEAMNLYLLEQGTQVTEKNMEFEIDIPQFFQYYRVINSKFLARRIGMNESLLSQYVHGLKKPSAAQTNRILAGIREIGQELSNLNFASG